MRLRYGSVSVSQLVLCSLDSLTNIEPGSHSIWSFSNLLQYFVIIVTGVSRACLSGAAVRAAERAPLRLSEWTTKRRAHTKPPFAAQSQRHSTHSSVARSAAQPLGRGRRLSETAADIIAAITRLNFVRRVDAHSATRKSHGV